MDHIKYAIELKYKTKKQSASSHGKIDIFSDIEALEIVTEIKFDTGKFYLVTDSKYYINQSVRGVGTEFATHNGSITEKNREFWFPSKGREHVRIKFRNSYHFEWEKIGEWYFLDLTIDKDNRTESTVSNNSSLQIGQ